MGLGLLWGSRFAGKGKARFKRTFAKWLHLGHISPRAAGSSSATHKSRGNAPGYQLMAGV